MLFYPWFVPLLIHIALSNLPTGYTHLIQGSGSILQQNEALDVRKVYP